MSFLDTNGLTYFYGKLKEKFIRSVNSITPDTNGNVVISNVDTANNLTSPDARASYGEFIYRTSGGTASLSSGEAQIAYVDGNVRIDGRIPESFQFTGQNGIIVSEYSADIWRSEIDTTGAYIFSYTKPTSISSTSDWSPQIGTWSYNGSQVNLSSYGLTVVNIIAPSLSITTNSSSISNIDITPNTWMSQISESGDYTFIYSETTGNWYLNSTSVTLNTYGINTHSGIPTDGDEIYVSYNAGTPNSTLTVNYTAADQGTIVVATPTAFKATGFNQFNGSTLVSDIKDTGIINNASISNGAIVNTSGRYICYVHAVGGIERGYVAYSESGTIRNIGWCENLPQLNESVVTTDSSVTNTISSILFANDGYVVVEVTSYNDLCVHPRWSTDDETYEAYVLPSIKQFPTVDVEDTPLPIGIYGMPSVGTVADRLDFDTGVYIKRIERIENNAQNMTYVQGLEVNYDWDSNYIYYVRPTPQNYIVDVNPIYTVNDFGTEEFVDTEVPLKAQLLYGQNLRDKLRTDVVTISAQSLSANQKAQVCTNIGAVNKAGDTMTGDLSFNKGHPVIALNNTQLTAGTAPQSTVTAEYQFGDSSGKEMAFLYSRYTTEKASEIVVRARNYYNNTTINNDLIIGVDGTGVRTVNVSDAVPWQQTLNILSRLAKYYNSQDVIDTMIDGTALITTNSTYNSSLYNALGATNAYVLQVFYNTVGSTNRRFQLAFPYNNTITKFAWRIYNGGWGSWNIVKTSVASSVSKITVAASASGVATMPTVTAFRTGNIVQVTVSSMTLGSTPSSNWVTIATGLPLGVTNSYTHLISSDGTSNTQLRLRVTTGGVLQYQYGEASQTYSSSFVYVCND